MSIYLSDMANWFIMAGLNVIEYDGWQTRARGSGGYSANPLCVMWHHTASPSSWDGQKDADYCAVGDPDAPLANLYIDRSGTVWVLAAGATNTNGKGYSVPFSRGTVPQDGMNTRAVGVEMGNDGIGESWPQVQVDAMFTVSNTVNAYLGNQPDDMCTHQFYAPDRKIDPATTNVEGPWVPSAVNSSGSWHRGEVQAECIARYEWTHLPPEDDDEMSSAFIIQNRDTGEVALIYGDHQMVGLAGGDLDDYTNRFGTPLITDPVVWAGFLNKA